MKALLFLAVLAVVLTNVVADPTLWMWSDPLNRPLPAIGDYVEPERLTFDPLCFCEYTWLGPHGYYNYWTLDDITYATYHDADHWDPSPHIEIIPCKVCYVTIQGANTVFIDEDTSANDMYIGGNKWDDTTVVLGHLEGHTILTLDYDDIPEIFSVDGERLTNGQTKITIVGKGFGFEADGLTIKVNDNTQDRPMWSDHRPDDCEFPLGCDNPGIPSTFVAPGIEYECTEPRIFHHDSFVHCFINTPDVFPQELQVTIQTSLRDPPLSASATILNTFIK